MATILVLHGPNLNLLGQREPLIYGQISLETINQELTQRAQTFGFTLDTYQANSEHLLIEKIHHSLQEGTRLIIFNPAGFTHTSIALRDALLAVALPFIEVHLSNIYKREDFRQRSYFSDIALGVISGLGPESYYAALTAAIPYLSH